MPIVEWNKKYSIGLDQVDNHHQHLFFLLNKFYDIFIIDAKFNDLNDLFDELIDYATYHFAYEERLMKESMFTSIEKHENEHRMFSKRIVELEGFAKYDAKHILIDAVVFMNEWLQAHILKSDAEFGRFIALNNIKIS